MQTCFISFNLFCKWKDFPQTYRIYLNDQLMTERDYIWDNDNHVLQERIPVVSSTDDHHIIKIEHIGQQTGRLRIDKLTTEPPGIDVKVNIV